MSFIRINNNWNFQKNAIYCLKFRSTIPLIWSWSNLNKSKKLFWSNQGTNTFGSCLPGTKLLQSPFRMEFSMGSLLWWYRRSLRHYHQLLHQYGFFFLWSPVHSRHICMATGPSATVWRLFEFVHCPINLCCISNQCNLKEISGAPCE